METTFISEPQPVKTRKPRTLKAAAVPKNKVRKHFVDNVNRNKLAEILDGFAADGRVVLALNISRDIGGTYEVVSYKDTVTPAE